MEVKYFESGHVYPGFHLFDGVSVESVAPEHGEPYQLGRVEDGCDVGLHVGEYVAVVFESSAFKLVGDE